MAYSPGAPAKNVLYIVFDDLRPELSFYGAPYMRTPALQKLADSGVVFERAYAQQTVCSPSRMSFTTGRRPNSTLTWNFLNHFRQAECPATVANKRFSGTPLAGTRHPAGVSFTGLAAGSSGGAAQCCTDCFAAEPHGACAGWTLGGTAQNNTCTLFSRLDDAPSLGAFPPCAQPSSPAAPCISGEGFGGGGGGGGGGGNARRDPFMPQWTPLPQHLRNSGFLVLGVGKYYHDVNKALGVAGDARFPAGTGLPPEADPVSWSNVSAQNVDLAAAQARYGRYNQLFKGQAYTGGAGFGYVNGMDGCTGKGEELCAAEKSIGANGSNAADLGATPLCDYIAYTVRLMKRRAPRCPFATGRLPRCLLPRQPPTRVPHDDNLLSFELEAEKWPDAATKII